MQGCIKQWLNFVKPNFGIYVAPQRDLAGGLLPACAHLEDHALTGRKTSSYLEGSRTRSPST